MDAKEVNRLAQLEVPIAVAIQIIEGRLSERVQVERFREIQRAVEWCEVAGNRTIRPCPQWDVDPRNFYFAGDGWNADKLDSTGYLVLYADTSEIIENLHEREWIESDPWSENYKPKTAVIAFRWYNGLPVTPPLLKIYDKTLLIQGGHHRLRYAHFLNAHRVPFLVARDKISRVEAILCSASDIK